MTSSALQHQLARLVEVYGMQHVIFVLTEVCHARTEYHRRENNDTAALKWQDLCHTLGPAESTAYRHGL